MKISQLSIILTFLFLTNCYSQWYIQNTPTTNRLRSTTFTDSINGWAAGYNGTILHTTNGGTNWTLENSNTSQTLFSIQFPNNNIGYAFGENGTFLKYSDGQWTAGQSGTVNRLYSSHFIDENNGWASGALETIIRTTDAGNNWQSQSVTHDDPLHSIYFIDANNGWAVTEGYLGDNTRYGIVFRTTDGGANWIQKFSLSEYLFHSVFFINPNTGWIAGSNGIMFRTDDGGNYWNYQYVPTDGWLYSVYFINQNLGWVVGDTDGIIFNTTNGGYTWVGNYTSASDWLFSIQFIDQNLGWAVGDNGRIQHTTNGSIPVELVSFSADNINSDVRLSWITASELNNKGFEIERKTINEYESIAFIEGSGTSTETRTYSFTDRNPGNGKYFYRLKQIDYDGSFKYSEEVSIDLNIPIEYGLKQNFPNPFNPTTKIEFTLPYKTKVNLEVYDILGQKVADLMDNYLDSGDHSVIFNGNNLPSGIYYYRLKTDDYSAVKKLMLVK
jgi:photosystem II stability/assembly factor-like uncharacterized protein